MTELLEPGQLWILNTEGAHPVVFLVLEITTQLWNESTVLTGVHLDDPSLSHVGLTLSYLRRCYSRLA